MSMARTYGNPKTLSKKILAVFLSILLVVTCCYVIPTIAHYIAHANAEQQAKQITTNAEAFIKAVNETPMSLSEDNASIAKTSADKVKEAYDKLDTLKDNAEVNEDIAAAYVAAKPSVDALKSTTTTVANTPLVQTDSVVTEPTAEPAAVEPAADTDDPEAAAKAAEAKAKAEAEAKAKAEAAKAEAAAKAAEAKANRAAEIEGQAGEYSVARADLKEFADKLQAALKDGSLVKVADDGDATEAEETPQVVTDFFTAVDDLAAAMDVENPDMEQVNALGQAAMEAYDAVEEAGYADFDGVQEKLAELMALSERITGGIAETAEATTVSGPAWCTNYPLDQNISINASDKDVSSFYGAAPLNLFKGTTVSKNNEKFPFLQIQALSSPQTNAGNASQFNADEAIQAIRYYGGKWQYKTSKSGWTSLSGKYLTFYYGAPLVGATLGNSTVSLSGKDWPWSDSEWISQKRPYGKTNPQSTYWTISKNGTVSNVPDTATVAVFQVYGAGKNAGTLGTQTRGYYYGKGDKTGMNVNVPDGYTAEVTYVPLVGMKPTRTPTNTAPNYGKGNAFSYGSPKTYENVKAMAGSHTIEAPAKNFTFGFDGQQAVFVAIKLIEKPKYSVTYTDGVDDEVVFENQVYPNLSYGASTPRFGDDFWTNSPRTGWSFTGWQHQTSDGTWEDGIIQSVESDQLYRATWKINQYPYTVNYLEQGTNKVLATQDKGNKNFGEEYTGTAKDIAGYNLVGEATQTGTIKTEGNVINFYYTPRTDLSYTVNYLEQGTDKALAEAKTVNGQTFGTEVTESAIDIDGYNKVDPTSVTKTIGVEGNVINFYYTPRTDLSYTVNYLEQGTDKALAEAKTVNGQTFGTEVTENAIGITGYDAVDPTSETINIGLENNVINFFYTKKVYTITVEVENGTASTDASFTANYGDDATITFTGDPGYALDTVTVDNEPAILTSTEDGTIYAFNNIQANHTIKVVYATDTTGTNDPGEGDDIPDKYQSTVTYKVKNGTWADQSTDAIDKVFTQYVYNTTGANLGTWTEIEGVVLGDTIPTGMIAGEGRDQDPGEWDAEIAADTAVVDGSVYIYDFDLNTYTITVDVENGTASTDATFIANYGDDATITFTGDPGYALDTVTVDNEPAILTSTEDGTIYAFNDIQANHTIKVVYAVDGPGTPDDPGKTDDPDGIPDKYQAVVTYQVQNGTWADEGTAPIKSVFTKYLYNVESANLGTWTEIEGVVLDDTIPTGMIAGEGRDQDPGEWDAEIAADTAVVDGSVYTYDFDLNTYTVTVNFVDDSDDAVVLQEKYTQSVSHGDMYNVKLQIPDSIDVNGDHYIWESTYNYATEDNETNGVASGDVTIDVVYTLDNIGNDPENPGDIDKPDNVPDKYQTIVTYAGVGGTVNGATMYQFVVTLTDTGTADGNWAKDGSYVLTDADMPETAAAEGFAGDPAWDVDPYAEANRVITKPTAFIANWGNGYIATYYDDVLGSAELAEVGVGLPINVEPAQSTSYNDHNYTLDTGLFDGTGIENNGAVVVAGDPGQNVVNVYYALDEVGPNPEDPANPNVPDGIADKYQAIARYVSADVAQGTVSGEVAKVFTFYNEDGSFATSGTITPGLEGVTTTANYGFVFDTWTPNPNDSVEANGGDVFTYTASWDVDVIGNNPEDPENPNVPDGIADKYQLVVNYVAVNGTMDATGTTNFATVLNKYDAEGNYAVDGVATIDTLYTATANEGYDPQTATWDPVIPGVGTKLTEDATYYVTFAAIPAPAPTPTPGGGTPTPAPAPGPAPTPAAAPGGPLTATIGGAATIADDPVPFAPADEAIDADENPLSNFWSSDYECWVHRLMFIGMLITLIYGVGVVLRRRVDIRELDKTQNGPKDQDMQGVPAIHVQTHGI